MSEPLHPGPSLSRRRLLRLGGAGLAAAAAASALPGAARVLQAAPAPAVTYPPPNPRRRTIALAATDGWVTAPDPANPSKWFPDNAAPENRNLFVFGFRDVTGMPSGRVIQVKGHAQISAPLLYVQQEQETIVSVTNLGIHQRPDLGDGHTLHWHGFRNAIPYYDGVPEMSLSVPIGRTLRYAYHPHDPGTYMYHCHFEDVEHVQMGMTGIVFVRPGQDRAPLSPGERYAYNDGDGSTAYDREFALLLTEMWLESHWKSSHIQQPDWSEYTADLWLMNGRSYPDTLEANGNPQSPLSDPRLRYNPISSLIRCNPGDRVLLRLANLGYQPHSMTLPGIPMRVVGKDATLLRGRYDQAQDAYLDTSYTTETIDINPGESFDAIFQAPPNNSTTIRRYLLFDRHLANRYLSSATSGGILSGPDGTPAGQITEVWVYPNSNRRPAQTTPNT